MELFNSQVHLEASGESRLVDKYPSVGHRVKSFAACFARKFFNCRKPVVHLPVFVVYGQIERACVGNLSPNGARTRHTIRKIHKKQSDSPQTPQQIVNSPASVTGDDGCTPPQTRTQRTHSNADTHSGRTPRQTHSGRTHNGHTHNKTRPQQKAVGRGFRRTPAPLRVTCD